MPRPRDRRLSAHRPQRGRSRQVHRRDADARARYGVPGRSHQHRAAAEAGCRSIPVASFICVSRTGVTGEQAVRLGCGRPAGRCACAQSHDLPLAVGFGISTAEQAAQVGAVADGVVVGSAIVRTDRKVCRQIPDLESKLEALARELLEWSRKGATMTTEDAQSKLAECRRVDRRHRYQTSELLNERTRVVEEIGRVKQELRCRSTSRSAKTRSTGMSCDHNQGRCPPTP